MYLGSRIAYNFLYIYVTDAKKSNLRTLSYLVGVGATSGVFVKAGNVANRGLF